MFAQHNTTLARDIETTIQHTTKYASELGHALVRLSALQHFQQQVDRSRATSERKANVKEQRKEYDEHKTGILAEAGPHSFSYQCLWPTLDIPSQASLSELLDSHMPAASKTTITGTASRKTEPHQKDCNIAPPTSGPTAPPRGRLVDQTAMATVRCRSSGTCNSVAEGIN